MFSRKTSDNLITLSLTEAAFILVFAVLLLIGSKLLIVARGEERCIADLSICSAERMSCKSDVLACKSQLAKIIAKPDDIVTTLVDAEKLRLENVDLKTRLDAATREAQGLKYLKEKFPKDPARLQTALEFLAGFESEKTLSLDPESANKRGQEASKAAKELQDCRGQLMNCKNRLGPSGFGHPPCWAEKSGAIQYVFDVQLRNDGVVVRPAWPPERDSDARALPGAVDLADGRVMRLEDFHSRAAGIFQSSRAATPECRHFVRLFRDPVLKDIDIFNRLRLGVEDYFYKRDLTKSGP